MNKYGRNPEHKPNLSLWLKDVEVGADNNVISIKTRLPVTPKIKVKKVRKPKANTNNDVA